jgi:hypothetical protein
MRCFSGVAVTLVLAGPAGAQCYICDEIVELNAEGARCFLDKYDSFRQPLAAGETTVEVDLGNCEDVQTSDGTRGGVQVMPGLAPRANSGLKTVFTFDDAYLSCLHDLVAAQDKIDPTIEFDLADQCPR